MIQKIEKTLNENIRPVLAARKGGIVLVEYDRQILKVKLTGSYYGSALSDEGKKLVLEEMKKRVPEVKRTIVIANFDDEILDIGKCRKGC
ncbi:MAG: NifU family protein [Fusobacteriaceae bacterium]|jgi:Fe-S cluster biogenesis protein NfuA|nr:NifU family protein [Fusobacteriaceae bacterium]